MSEDLVQATNDRDANAVRSPEDEGTLGEVAWTAYGEAGRRLREPGAYALMDEAEKCFWGAAATAVRDKVMEWKTIETAPKDGIEIDVWCWQPDGEGYRIANAWWSEVDQKWRTYGDERQTWMHQPTHWLPLPSPPCVPDRRD